VIHKTTPYRPEGKGRVENRIRTVTAVLKKLLHGENNSWDQVLPLATLYINLKPDLISKSRPFDLFFGRTCDVTGWGKSPQDLIQLARMETFDDNEQFELSIENWKDHMKKMKSIIYPTLAEKIKVVRTRNSERLNLRRLVIPTSNSKFVVGASVMIKDVARSSKLDSHYIGPFKIKKVHDNGTFTLEDHDGVLNRQVPISHLKYINQDSSIAQDDQIYEVEQIVSHRGPRNKREFLVKWLNYESMDWVPQENFYDARIIQDYMKLNNIKNN
jgi:hypothetical protein